MSEATFFHILIIAWFFVAGVIFISLFFITAPYGRHTTHKWGTMLRSSTGWIIMEAAAPVVFAVCFFFGENQNNLTAMVFLALWEAHYLHRAFIYPLHRRSGEKTIPLTIVILGLFFNAVNGYLNGRYLFTLSPGLPDQWLIDPRFISGVIIFITGFFINRNSDLILRKLRKPGDNGYSIAHHGLFRWVSCPNYLGEIIIWSGWALATWSIAGLSFAIWTAANLIPRARAHHLWYKEHFTDYPEKRKALVPGLW